MTIDTTTNAIMQQIQNPILTLLSKTIAIITEPVILILISLAIATYLYINKQKKQAIFLSLTILTTGIIIKISKEIFQRARPLNALIQETSFSFPSGHATMATVFFGLIAYLFANKKNKTKAILTSTLIVTIIAFTRIYLRVHWLTDILGGFVLGIIILMSSIFIYKKLAR